MWQDSQQVVKKYLFKMFSFQKGWCTILFLYHSTWCHFLKLPQWRPLGQCRHMHGCWKIIVILPSSNRVHPQAKWWNTTSASPDIHHCNELQNQSVIDKSIFNQSMRHLQSPDTAFLSYVSIYFIAGWEMFDFIQKHELFLQRNKDMLFISSSLLLHPNQK